MKLKPSLALVLLLLSQTFRLGAQEPVPEVFTLSLNDAVKLALEQDPSTGGLRADLRAARETEAQGSSFSLFSKPPEFRIGSTREGFARRGFTKVGGDDEVNYAIRVFPLNPWELKARRAFLTARTTAARDASSAGAFSVEIEVRALYFDALLSQELSALAAAASARQKELRDTLEKLLSQGQALLPAVVRARANVVKLSSEAQVRQLRSLAARQELVHRIGGLSVPVSQVTLSAGWPVSSQQITGMDLASLIERAVSRRPDLATLASEAATARAKANAESESDGAWLTFVEATYNDNRDTGIDQHGFRLGVSVPLGGPANLGRLEALGKSRALSEQHSLLRRSIANQVRDAYDNVRISAQNWTQIETDLLALRKDVASVLKEAATRQIYRPEDIGALQFALIDAEEAAVRARHATHQAALQLDAALGESCLPVAP